MKGSFAQGKNDTVSFNFNTDESYVSSGSAPANGSGFANFSFSASPPLFGHGELRHRLLWRHDSASLSGSYGGTGELQSPTRRGQVDVFEQASPADSIRWRRKMEQTPDFAVLLLTDG